MLKNKLLQALKSTGLFRSGNLILVGVSGGPDSVALLLALHEIQPDFGYHLHVAHFNHRLRGEQSDQDAEYVSDLAERLGLPFTIAASDVLSLSEQRKLGLEEAARVARYSFFARLASSLGAVGVVVGHTSNDQVETVTMHWLRGTSLAGLRGMTLITHIRGSSRSLSDSSEELIVIRPMLSVSRREVEEFLLEHSITAREDISNLDRRFLRNKIRLEIVPFLEQYNPQLSLATLRLASSAAEDFDFIQRQLLDIWPSVASVGDDAVTFDLPGWLALPATLQRYALRHAAVVLLGDALDLTAEHLNTAAEAMRTLAVGATIEWPRGIRVVKSYKSFDVRKGGVTPLEKIEGVHQISIPGVIAIPGTPLEVIARVQPGRCIEADNDPWHADLDYDATGAVIFVRRRRAGDVMQPLGMDRYKKLQDFFVDQKVPRQNRDSVPIVASPNSIIWVAGHRIDDRFKVTPQTTKVLCLRIFRYN